MDTVLRLAAGSAGTPAFSAGTTVGTNNGFTAFPMNVVGISIAGSFLVGSPGNYWIVDTSAGIEISPSGSAAVPNIAIKTTDNDNGLYYIGTDNMDLRRRRHRCAWTSTPRASSWRAPSISFSIQPAQPPSSPPAFAGFPLGNSNAAITADYTLVLADAGKTILHNSGSTHTVTIPANASVAYPIGTTTIIDNAGGNSGAPLAR